MPQGTTKTFNINNKRFQENMNTHQNMATHKTVSYQKYLFKMFPRVFKGRGRHTNGHSNLQDSSGQSINVFTVEFLLHLTVLIIGL